jgi:hypothetical protein
LKFSTTPQERIPCFSRLLTCRLHSPIHHCFRARLRSSYAILHHQIGTITFQQHCNSPVQKNKEPRDQLCRCSRRQLKYQCSEHRTMWCCQQTSRSKHKTWLWKIGKRFNAFDAVQPSLLQPPNASVKTIIAERKSGFIKRSFAKRKVAQPV